MSIFTNIEKSISKLDFTSIGEERRSELKQLIEYTQNKIGRKEPVQLNFICTHNSRRSQFAQVWAQVAAWKYGVPLKSFSGGVEITACNHRTIKSLKRTGFVVRHENGENPVYHVRYDDDQPGIELFSKLFDDPINPSGDFAAIMTCSHADENCPLVSGCDERISLRYSDPKEFDNTPYEAVMYDQRSMQIATEMMYVFHSLRNV